MDPFATLGLPATFRLDPKVLEQRYRDLQRALHPDRFTGAPVSERRMALSKAVEVNEAYRVLRDDLRRAEHLVSSRLGSVREAADPELLMTVMELREALSEAKAAKDLAGVRKLAAKVGADANRTREALAAALDDAPQGDAGKLTRLLSELKYYQRFLDEVAVIEDDADNGSAH